MGLIQRFKEWREKRNEKWHIIDNMHELPIGKYLEIIEIGKREGDDIDKSTAVLQVLTGWSVGDIENLSLAEYSALASGCAWLYEPPKPVAVAKEYRCGDYTLRPTSADKLTTAQYIDFQAFVQDTDRYIVELLSVLLVPVGKRYGEGYDMAKVQEWIRRTLPADSAISLVAFFLHNANELMRDTLLSSEEAIRNAPAKTEEQKETKRKAMKIVDIIKNGVGKKTSKS